MAKEKKSEKKEAKKVKKSDARVEVEFTAGAMYGKATGDTLGGMELLYSQSKDLERDPTISIMRNQAAIYSATQTYKTRAEQWEKAPKETRGDKPTIDPEFLKSEEHTGKEYQRLLSSQESYAEMFESNLQKLKVKELKQTALRQGKLPEGIDKAVTSALSDADKTVIGDIEDEKIASAIFAIENYYITGSIAEKVALNRLEQTLNNSELAMAA
jgi:hypothetical protein